MFAFELARALDVFFAVFWRKKFRGVTISAICGLALRQDPKVRNFNGYLGRFLNWLVPGHCEDAIKSDLSDLQASVKALS